MVRHDKILESILGRPLASQEAVAAVMRGIPPRGSFAPERSFRPPARADTAAILAAALIAQRPGEVTPIGAVAIYREVRAEMEKGQEDVG